MRTLSERSSLWDARFKTYWLLNVETGEVHSLGPMYGGTVAYATQKLKSERLPYEWRLLVAVPEIPT